MLGTSHRKPAGSGAGQSPAVRTDNKKQKVEWQPASVLAENRNPQPPASSPTAGGAPPSVPLDPRLKRITLTQHFRNDPRDKDLVDAAYQLSIRMPLGRLCAELGINHATRLHNYMEGVGFPPCCPQHAQ